MFSLRSVVRFRVERRDHGTIVTCEATHPALGGQRRQTQYMLDVQCEWGALGGGYGGYGGFGGGILGYSGIFWGGDFGVFGRFGVLVPVWGIWGHFVPLCPFRSEPHRERRAAEGGYGAR